MEADAHPVGVHHPQGTVVAELVAVPHLIWRNVSGGGEREINYPLCLLVTREQNPYFYRFPWHFAAASVRLPSISTHAM